MHYLNHCCTHIVDAVYGLMVLGDVRAQTEHSVGIVEQLAVVNTNGSGRTVHINPKLTDLDESHMDTIAQAASLLLQSIRLGGMPNVQKSFDCQLIELESSGPAPEQQASGTAVCP